MHNLSQTIESDCRIDVITEHSFACVHVAGKHAFDAFTEKLSSESCVALRARLDGGFQSLASEPLLASRVIQVYEVEKKGCTLKHSVTETFSCEVFSS